MRLKINEQVYPKDDSMSNDVVEISKPIYDLINKETRTIKANERWDTSNIYATIEPKKNNITSNNSNITISNISIM